MVKKFVREMSALSGSLARFKANYVATIAFVLVGLLSSTAYCQLAGTSTVNSTLPPPPAFLIAQALAAQGQFAQAAKKLGDVATSATYKRTPYAPEAVYSIAHLQEDKLHDDNSAIASLNTLVNTYSDTDYPHRPVVLGERTALALKIDTENEADARKGPTWSSGNPIYDLWEALLATGYLVIKFFVDLTGAQTWSYWVALLLISVIVRGLLTPLTLKQYQSMRETQRIQPLMKELQTKYKNDKAMLNTKTMELYKEHNVNPAAGCLPMLLQFPVFIYMYHAVWLYQYHFSHGTFAWINPAAHRLAPSVFGANLADQDLVLLAMYAASMYVTQRMMPAADPSQAEMQKTTALMSAIFFFVFFQNYHFPSAFVLYWFISNVLSSLTQLYFMRQGLIPPRGVTPSLPTDGEPGAVKGTLLNGNAKQITASAMDGASNTNGSSAQGTAKGVIGPKIHPKKKRR